MQPSKFFNSMFIALQGISHLHQGFKVKLLAVLLATLAGISVAFVGCESHRSRNRSLTLREKLPGEPLIRVRIQKQTTEVTLTRPATIQVFTADAIQPQLISTPVKFTLANGQWQAKSRTTHTFKQDTLHIKPLGPTELAVNNTTYPGIIKLVPSNAPSTSQKLTLFDTINAVRLEAYLPGVISKELYADWSPATYLAQSIAARTYAIDRMINAGPGRHYDVESTQASQAYIGKSNHTLAIRSVIDTAGMVLTYQDQIFPAFYSSTCGGVAQSADVAFEKKYPRPLNIVNQHKWCTHSKHYKWDDIVRNRYTLSKRIAAWGKSNRYLIGKLDHITHITVDKRNEYQRPTLFAISDASGLRYTLNPESFRQACNYSGKNYGLEPIASKTRLKSAFVEVKIIKDKVIFSKGHGFGHGVGMCQYGAEGMAKSGRNVNDILQEYYPTATLERAY